ncbi:MAG: hypothetical protein M3Q03_12330 [Chloroflexota bacterium]|nr:hypothetical protein [Chloroflexota bacterium]
MTAKQTGPAILAAVILALGLALATQAPQSASAHAILSAHLHDGVCSQLGNDVVELGELGFAAPLLGTPVATPSDGFQSVGAEGAFPTVRLVETVDASLDRLIEEPHALDVHIINEEEGVDIVLACGNVGGVRTGDDLVFGLQAQPTEGTATTGIAWLHANADGTTTIRLFIAQGLAPGSVGPSSTPMS